MKLPVIKHLTTLIEEKDVQHIEATIATLESVAEAPSIKDEEMDVIGELLSNLYGAVEVHQEVQNGIPKKEALNGFMRRVVGSIDR